MKRKMLHEFYIQLIEKVGGLKLAQELIDKCPQGCSSVYFGRPSGVADFNILEEVDVATLKVAVQIIFNLEHQTLLEDIKKLVSGEYVLAPKEPPSLFIQRAWKLPVLKPSLKSDALERRAIKLYQAMIETLQEQA